LALSKALEEWFECKDFEDGFENGNHGLNEVIPFSDDCSAIMFIEEQGTACHLILRSPIWN